VAERQRDRETERQRGREAERQNYGATAVDCEEVSSRGSKLYVDK